MIATRIITEDQFSWLVACEGANCPNGIRVPKVTYTPDGTRVEAPAPEARRCAACGPFAR